MPGKIVAVCRSVEKGTVKENIERGRLITDFGLEGDAHGGDWHRQVSLLAEESIDKMRSKGFELDYGDFAENLTTRGVALHQLPVGSQLKVGNRVLLEVTQIGKECHHDCQIKQEIGSCIMPTEGIFARVIQGGVVKAGDQIEVI